MGYLITSIYSILMYVGTLFLLSLLNEVGSKEDKFYLTVIHFAIFTGLTISSSMIDFNAGLFLFGAIYLIDLAFTAKVVHNSFKKFLKEEGDC